MSSVEMDTPDPLIETMNRLLVGDHGHDTWIDSIRRTTPNDEWPADVEVLYRVNGQRGRSEEYWTQDYMFHGGMSLEDAAFFWDAVFWAHVDERTYGWGVIPGDEIPEEEVPPPK